MKKRMISLLLIAVMLLGMFPALSAAATDLSWDTQAVQPENGSGTAEDPYQITSGAELAWFAQTVGETRDADAVLTQDIDLSGFAWTPIGTAYQGYQGTFDGQGHTIRGLAVSGMEYAGLFACVDGGTVKRVIVSGSVSGTSVAGGIAAQLKNGASVLECGNEADVQCGGGTSGGNCGGIAGCAGPNDGKNTIERCYNAGTVTCEKKSNDRAGGILGYDQGKAAITDCYNTGTINGGTYAGGIRGYLSTMAGKITNCYNAGQISAATTGTIAPSGKYDGENCYGLKNGDIVKDTLSEGETAQALSQAELLAALNGETGSSWKRDLTVNGGYPILSWQAVDVPKGTLGQAENVAFEREVVDTLDGDENSLPTAMLTWDAVKDATGYVAALWQKTRVWRELSAEEKAAYAQPLQDGETYSERLLNVDQDVILAEFTTAQLQALYALQTKLDQAQDTLTQAVDARNSASEDEYEAANTAYKNALAAYETAYQACCEYIIKQAVENDLPLGDYWSEIELSAAVKLGAQTSYDFTKEFSKLDDGVYYATVSAIDDNGGYTIPTADEVNETVVGWQDPYTRMKPITNLSWDGTVAKWDPKDYFTDDQVYRIDLYIVESTGYTFYKTFQVAASVHMADFKNAFSAMRSYVFTVTAIADGDLETKYGVSDSIVSAFSPVYRPAGAPEIKEWVDITSAEQWMEIANTKDEKVDPSDPNSKNKQEIAWSKNYRLANDIDFSKLSAVDQNRTKSIGTIDYPFQGEFDGQGYEIKGLTLTNKDSGLFWFVGSLGYIHDVKITNPNVHFSDNAAVLVHNNYGIIEKCAIINCNINADIGAAIGGMVSRNYGIIRDSYVQGGQLNSHSTTATSHAGFVGTQEEAGLIERCWTSMDITTESDWAGGFAGQNYGGTIRDCFALGNVSARNCSGGFVGRTAGEKAVYENCYAAGVVKCTGYDGHGFIGGNLSWSGLQYDQTIGISNCYYNQASEEAAINYNAIGMTLDAMKSNTFCNLLGSRWERDNALNDGLPYLTGVKVPTKAETDEILVTIELIRYNKEAYRFEKFGDEIDVELASSGNTRVMDLMDAAQEQHLLTYGYEKTSYGRYVSKINGYEVLAPDGWMFTINGKLSNVGVSLATVKQGDKVVWFEGTTQNHFQPPRADELDPDSGYWTKISSAEELLQLASASDEDAMAGHYILTKDIDLKDVAFPGIGSERAPFTGTFDGDGHTISNLSISLDGEDNVGMFRVIKGATIKNLRLDNVTVSGASVSAQWSAGRRSSWIRRKWAAALRVWSVTCR